MSTIYLPQAKRIDVDNYVVWDTRTDLGYFRSLENFDTWRAQQRYPEEWSFEDVELAVPEAEHWMHIDTDTGRRVLVHTLSYEYGWQDGVGENS